MMMSKLSLCFVLLSYSLAVGLGAQLEGSFVSKPGGSLLNEEQDQRSLQQFVTDDSCNLLDLQECLTGNEGYGGCSILARPVGNWCDASHLGFGSVCCGPVESCCQLSSHGIAILILSFLMFVSMIAMACCAVYPFCPLYTVLCIAPFVPPHSHNQDRTGSPRHRRDIESDDFPIGSCCKPSAKEVPFWEVPFK